MSGVAMDDVDDEEVVFDQTTLLTRRFKPTTQQEKSGRCARLIQTFLLCCAFFGLGLCIAMPGPTLLDLEARTNTNTSRISQIFTGRSVGYLFGSIVSGFLYDRFNQNCLLSFSLIVTAVGTALAPWSKNFMVLMVFIALQGVSMGFLDTGGNVFCMTIWGRSSPPYMQALHFSFGLGAFVAPLLAEPFLSKATNVTAQLPYSHISHMINENEDSNNAGGVSDKTVHRFVRAPPDTAGTPVLSHAASTTVDNDRPKKPEATSADFLNKNRKVADGTNTAKAIKNLPKVVPVLTTTLVPPPTDARNNSDNSTVVIPQQTLLPTTTLPTTTTTSPPPTTTTTIPTTTTTSKPTTTTSMPTTTTVKKAQENSASKSTAKNPGARSVYSTHNSTSNETESGSGNSPAEIIERVRNVIQTLTNIQFAYLAIAAYLIVIAFCFMIMCCCSRQGIRAVKNQDISESEYMIHKETKGFRVQILVLMFFFYFLYSGMEVTYGGLIMIFAVKYLGWSKAEGTLLTSVFWGSFALARGISIFFGVCLSPALMLIGDLVMTCLSLAGLVMALDSNHIILWFCTAVLGAGMASIFPTGITWAERYMRMTGKATSVLVVGSALGEMFMPALTGYLFETKGPMWLLYIMLGAGLLSAVLYIIMQNLASNKGERYEKLTQWLGSSSTDSGTEDQDMEMDSLASNSTTNLLEILSPTSNGNGKKKVSFNLPKDINPKSIANKYRPSFLGKNSAKRD